MKILITGHSGLLGNALMERLSKDHEVYGVSRTNRLNAKNTALLDLQDADGVQKLFDEVKPDVVYHLAANASESRGQVSPMDMVNRNVVIATNVLTAAINVGVKKFIFASSISVYGDAPTPWSEDMMPMPKDVYGVNKFSFEQILKIMSKVHGFDYTILRPHNIYGPGQNMADPSKNVIALFMRKLIEKQPYTMFGEGAMQRAFSYVDDVAEVFAKALYDFSGVTMNIGSTKAITIKQLSDALQVVSGVTVPIDYKPMRPQEMGMFIATHDLQRRKVEYNETPLYEGLEKTWVYVNSTPLPVVNVMDTEIHAHPEK